MDRQRSSYSGNQQLNDYAMRDHSRYFYKPVSARYVWVKALAVVLTFAAIGVLLAVR